MAGVRNAESLVAVAYISHATPAESRFDRVGVHRGGAAFARGVLVGVAGAESLEVEAISAEPMASFPRCKQLWVTGRGYQVSPSVRTRGLPFMNLTPLKQVMIAIGTAVRLIVWRARSWRARSHIVLLFNLTVPPIAVVWAVSRLLGVRVAAYVVDVSVPGQTVPNTTLHRLDAWLQRRYLPRLDALVGITDQIATLAPCVPFIRIDGGLDHAWLHQPPSAGGCTGRGQHEFLLVVAGKLCEYNGIPEICETMNLIEDMNLRLIVAGQGPLEDFVRAAARRDSRIRYDGYLDRMAVARLYARADALISMRIVSRLDTRYAFPSKTMECLASGVPVIATATGHLSSEYGDKCIVLVDDSPEALRDAIGLVRAMSAQDRVRIGASAATYIREQKSWESQGRRIAAFLSAHSPRPVSAGDRGHRK